MAIVCNGVLGYDLRTSIKAEAGETLTLGQSVYIANDGKVYRVDGDKSTVCHGWVLEDAVAGDTITVMTKCRLRVATTQVMGARVYTGAVAGGSAPSTTLAAAGVIVGVAYKANEVFLQVPVPAADAGAP